MGDRILYFDPFNFHQANISKFSSSMSTGSSAKYFSTSDLLSALAFSFFCFFHKFTLFAATHLALN
ncbi:uncharacterized protein DS421_4g111910 [Arachis hypogaea]|nr:uncharacterized protein DS421_4g111910 [Arachis hypogaea]